MHSETIVPIFIDGSSMLATAYWGTLPRSIISEKDPELSTPC